MDSRAYGHRLPCGGYTVILDPGNLLKQDSCPLGLPEIVAVARWHEGHTSKHSCSLKVASSQQPGAGAW